jgi:hypothetical protein
MVSRFRCATDCALLMILLSLPVIGGCGGSILRDREAYTEEVLFVRDTANEGALAIRSLVDALCDCGPDGEWETEPCRNAAFAASILEERVVYHADFMLFLIGYPGIERPEGLPPEVTGTCTID